MSEPTLRPIWTPEDAAQTACDAAQHVAIPGAPVEPEGMLPFRRPVGATCASCGAWPDERCEAGCLNLMTDEQQRAHRDSVLDSVIAELGIEESAPFVVYSVATPRPTGAHRRPTSPASHFAKMTLAVVVLVLVLVVGVLWAAGRANALATNCQQQPWLYGGLFGRMTTRTICDGPIRTDGSWLRNRNFYAPAYDVPVSCSWTRAGGGCSGGYRKPVFDTGIETYVVTPETVLADEPGHIA